MPSESANFPYGALFPLGPIFPHEPLVDRRATLAITAFDTKHNDAVQTVIARPKAVAIQDTPLTWKEHQYIQL